MLYHFTAAAEILISLGSDNYDATGGHSRGGRLETGQGLHYYSQEEYV